MGTLSRRTALVGGIAGTTALGLAGVGTVSGVLDPRAPWLGLTSLTGDAAGQISTLDGADVAADGAGEPAVDLYGRHVAAEPGDELPSTSVTARMGVGSLEGDANPDWFTVAGSRLRVPAVDLDAPLLAMSAVDGVATPPGFRACYALRNFGSGLQDPSAGAVVVLCHSAMRRTGPGNFLIDVDAGEPIVPAGAAIEVAGVPYVFESAQQVRKTALPDHDRAWADRPGDLVLITCRQVGGARTTHNTVLFAHLDDAGLQ